MSAVTESICIPKSHWIDYTTKSKNQHQSVMLLMAVLCFVSVAISSAQDRDDQVVLKAYPSNIHCRRNAAQRRSEVAELNRQLRERGLTTRSTLYRACYKYSIVGRNTCQLNTEVSISEIVTMLDTTSVPNTGGQIIIAQTPIEDDGLYPSDTVCFYVIGNKRAGFVYQYVEGFFGQDLQGGITIRTKPNNNNDVLTVTDGKCHDFFEFREKIQDERFGGIDTLVTCGNQSDPRIQFSLDLLDPMVPDALTLVFRSDSTVRKKGIYLVICEINTASSPTAHGGRRRRQTGGSAPQGLQGKHGETGLHGKLGEKGKSGINGLIGATGRKGEKGVAGIKGPEGPPSTVAGYQGQQGKQGPVGPKGVSCKCKALKSCIPGHKGDKGWPGQYGFRGAYGSPGPRGYPGKPGPRGLPGVRGRKGSKGSDGLNGLDGPPGEPGPRGPRGQPGPPGPPGLAGCPLPPGHELSRRMTELGYITEVTEKIYHHTVKKEVKRSVSKLHNYLVDEMIEHKEKLTPTKLSSEVSSTNTHSRDTRQIVSSEECGGVPLTPGTTGEPGMKGRPGPPGQNGHPGRPGTVGAHGIGGVPGEPGLPGQTGLTGNRGSPGDKGKPGPVGKQGLPGQCECYKYKTTLSYGRRHTNAKRASSTGYGLKGPHGDTGSPGLRGPPGYTGKRGYTGRPGQKGPVGYTGADGVSGRIGPAGSPGPKGLPGPRGLPGNNGPAGPRGPPACQCNNLRIFLDRYGFVIPPRLLTDEEGVALYNKNEVNLTFVEIPCVRQEDQSILGRKGEQGRKGYQGPRGDPGKPGVDGMVGALGQKGAKGDRGYPGPKGFKGSDGPPGKLGLPGVQGPQGYKGDSDLWCILNSEVRSHHSKLVRTQCPQGCPNGAKGVKGKMGPTGPRGYPGSTGPIGFAGPRGPRGFTGLPGYPGDEGCVGHPGNRGPRGHQGLPGDPGPVGPSGPPGPSDSCPEFDGVDLNEFFQPTMEEVNDLEELLETQDAALAMDRINSSFPVLRELASFIASGGIIPRPPVICARIDLASVNNDSVTVEFRGVDPFTCQLDYRHPKPCTSPINYTGLSAGRHRVDITARNKTCKANTTFIIPVWLNVGSPIVNCDSVKVNFSANGRTDCKLDNGKFRYCRSFYLKTWLSSGQHKITIRASDGLGRYKMEIILFTIQLGKPYWSPWGEWTPCTKSCGGGTSRRNRMCLFPKCRDYNYYQCDGKYYEIRSCNEQCCQEKPYWGPWAHWSSCSKSCGGGITFRKRQCYHSQCPHPDYKNCIGNDYEESKCNTQCCPEKSNWAAWTEWSTCSSSCGGGLSFRMRHCISSKCPYRKSNCYGSGYEKRECNEQCCPETPYWSAWTYWSPCSKTCGGGITYRNRTCYKSKCLHPSYPNCPGDGHEQKTCNSHQCPESETPSLHIKLTVTRQKGCVYIGYTLTRPATTNCYINNKQWDKCYSPLVLCLSELQQGDHFGYISATNEAKQIATANFRFTLHV